MSYACSSAATVCERVEESIPPCSTQQGVQDACHVAKKDTAYLGSFLQTHTQGWMDRTTGWESQVVCATHVQEHHGSRE